MWLALACAPPQQTDELTPPATHATLETAVELAGNAVARWPPESLALSWVETVFSWGLHRLHVRSEDPLWHDAYASWIASELPAFTGDDPRGFSSSDTMSPSILASTAMIEDPSLDFTPITDAAHGYLACAPRTSQGAIAHWATQTVSGSPSQVWVDSQFMFGVFLLQENRRTGDDAMLELFVEQYGLFSELCRDEEDELYRHSYDDATGENVPADDTYWARGNAWVLISAAEYLDLVGPDAGGEVRTLFQDHMDAVLAHQDPEDGLWHTVLNEPRGDDPENYSETSASALIAYAIVRGLESGALDEGARPALTAAVDGVLARIEDGVVTGASVGTNPGPYEYYVAVPTLDDWMLGVGTVVMMLAEVDGVER